MLVFTVCFPARLYALISLRSGYAVLEYASGGQIMDWLPTEHMYRYKSGPDALMPEATARTIFRDMLLGLDYCALFVSAVVMLRKNINMCMYAYTVHEHHIVHRDIKPDNVLYCQSSCTYKLADLGVSHFFDSDTDTLTKTEGTPPFFAPECCVGMFGDSLQRTRGLLHCPLCIPDSRCSSQCNTSCVCSCI